MVWLGSMFIIFAITLSIDLGRVVVWLVGKAIGGAPPDPARRLFLARLAGGAIAALGTAAIGSALRSARGRVRVKTLEVRLPRLPARFDGLKLVQIADVHVGPTIGRGFIDGIVETINRLEPDIVAITGDLVDGSVPELRDAVSPLGTLKARHGVYFVTGNHEYYSGAVGWCAHLEKLGIKVLRNQRVSIGDGGDSFDLAGIDDYSSEGMAPGHGPDLAQALSGRDPSRALVLLAHQPRAIHEAAEQGVGLQLSGHTHGGQIWPWRYLVYLQQPFVAGLGKLKDTLVYVSCGTGYWGPPMRLFAPPEITKIVLRSA
jgi:predicted MPP superfamily phosphohydrolase